MRTKCAQRIYVRTKSPKWRFRYTPKYLEIPDFEGVWASGEDMRECLNELDEVLLDWLLLKIEDEDKDIPLIDGIDLNVL